MCTERARQDTCLTLWEGLRFKKTLKGAAADNGKRCSCPKHLKKAPCTVLLHCSYFAFQEQKSIMNIICQSWWKFLIIFMQTWKGAPFWVSLSGIGLAGWSAGLKYAIPPPTFHCSGLMSNVTLWLLSPDQLLNSPFIRLLQHKLKWDYF